jgi:hypothetical protein
MYYELPPKLRAFLFPVETVFYSIKRVLFFVSKFRLSVYLLQGKEKWGGGSLKTLFLGDERGIHYFSDLLYLEEPVKESLGKVFIWEIKSRLNLELPRTDLIFIKIDGIFSRFLSRKGFIIIPGWVLFIMDLSRPLQEIWKLSKNKSLRENLRQIKKQNYSYEMTQDPSKFEYFYHQMYLPYAWKRFEKVTVLTSFRDMERAFKKGQLLLIKKGNDYISGVIIRMDHDTVFSVSLGIKEGKIEYLKEGALTACYYFTILWAKEEGYKWLDFGHCRSFFKDGVFNYKKRWGMGIKLSTRVRTIFGMKVCNFHQGVRTLLENNPFIFIDQEKLKGLILVDQNHPLIPEEVQSLVKTYCIPELDCLVILSDQGFTQQAEEFANSCSTQRLHLISTKTDTFFEAFPHVLHSGRA